MSESDEARYGRACLLVLNICPFTLRKVIDDFYTRSGSHSLQEFLDKHKHDLFHLLSRSCCCRSGQSRVSPMDRSQWELLYDKNALPCNKGHKGDCPCQYDAKPGITTGGMDVTLCCLVIHNVCPGVNMSHIKTIREIRNNLIHANSATLDEITFNDYWIKVDKAISDLARHVVASPSVLKETQKRMKELQTRVMDSHELGEMRKLIVDQKKFAQLEEKIDQAQKDIEQLQDTAGDHSRQIHGLNRQVQNQEYLRRWITWMWWILLGIIWRLFNRDGEPDISKLRKRLINIYSDTTKVIPISPLEKRGKDRMPIELLYASVAIREEQTAQEKGDNSPREIYCFTDSDTDSLSTHESSSEDGKSDVSDDSEAPLKYERKRADPADIFIKDGKLVRNIYMLGDAAHGKTTYCMWLLKKWCNIAQPSDGIRRKELDKWENVMKKFDFVFLVQCRYVNPDRASVIDMICQDVFARYTDYHAAIRHVLSSDKYRSLIIMDGLDEWNPYEETKRQLTYQRMPNIEGVSSSVSCFFSMRTWMFSAISEVVEVGDRVIEIFGLSEAGMEKVIRNVLLNHYNLKKKSSKFTATYNKIIRHLEEKNLKSFMQIPLLAVVCVQIWYEGKQVGDSMASFYTSMLNLLIERAQLKHKIQKSLRQTMNHSLPKLLSAKKNIKNSINVLLKLGKVAYEGLLSKQMKLVFQTEDLETEIGERELQFALDVGVISQKEAHSLTTNNVSLHFFHKSIQEFLAAIYIVTQKKVSESFCKHLSNVKVIMELSNVIMFICGMCPSLGSVISQRVVSVTDSDTEICKYRESLKHNSTVEELYKLQVSWCRELKYGQTDSLVTQTDGPAKQTDSPVTQTDSPVTQTDIPVIQTDRTVTQTDRPATQPDRPVTQTDVPVVQTDRPVIFHVSDVCLVSYSDTETVRVTRELLSDRHVDIRSLWLEFVRTELGVTYTVLDDFLSNTHRTRSLAMIHINGNETDRCVPTLCVPTLRCLHLEHVTISSHLCGNVCPPLLTDMSQLRVLELERVTLGEGGLGLSSDMVHIEEVMLRYVEMPAAGWRKFVRSVSHIQHRFNVVLYYINIDDMSLKMILSPPDFSVTKYDVDVFGRYVLDFTREWPPSQLTQDDGSVYTRV